MVRPKDLRLPFPWNERHVVIHNRVWLVPPRALPLPFAFPGWDHPELFGINRPVRIEYCSGNGDWIVARAKQDPESSWVAVEKRLDRVKKIWSKSVNNGVHNIVIVWAEAFEFTKQFIPTETIQEVFVNFPDPWPKRKHAANRIIRPEFVGELGRIVKPSGKVTLVTDDEPYAASMLTDMPSTGHFINDLAAEVSQDYGSSFFESLFRTQDKTIRQLEFSRL
jgi:tRNA (guanine-N7-)-methyltransferase